MKKGISLIVLVITIIVMIILAAAIIISISNSNVINKANQAVEDTNLQSVKEAAALKYADATLKMKEDGNDSILGGKTLGGYIQSSLVTDGTIPTDAKYIFANSGAVYGVNEYEFIDKDTVKDYRYINGTLYYVGTNIQNRLALKNNPNVNTEYIFLDFKQYQYQNEEYWTYKLNDLSGYQGEIKSYKEMTVDDSGINPGVNRASLQSSDNIILATGMTLYLGENYTNKLGMVVVFGDLWGTGFISTSSAADFYDYVYSIETIENYDINRADIVTGWIKDEHISQIGTIYNLVGDIDMNGVLNGVDAVINMNLAFASEMLQGVEEYINKSVSQMDMYTNAVETNNKVWYDNDFRVNKAWLSTNLNINKVITSWPTDIAK